MHDTENFIARWLFINYSRESGVNALEHFFELIDVLRGKNFSNKPESLHMACRLNEFLISWN